MISRSDGSLKLIDFGLTIRFDEAARAPITTSYQSKLRLGVPGYMPPEVYEKRPYGAAVDIFAFGKILHRLLCAMAPPPASERLRDWWCGALCSAVPWLLYPRLVGVLPTSRRWPRPLASLASECCSRQPERRPGAAQLVQTLEASAEQLEHGV